VDKEHACLIMMITTIIDIVMSLMIIITCLYDDIDSIDANDTITNNIS
jgi:hypothetical protein